MALERVSSIALLNNTLTDVTGVEQQLADLQQQVSSGHKAQDFQGLNGSVEEYTQISAKIDTANQYQTSNSIGIARMQAADTAMTQIQTTLDGMQSLIVSARNPSNQNSLDFEVQMKGYLQALGDQLNTNFDGKFIFGGTNTTSAPIANPLYRPLNPGVPDAGYYTGSSQDVIYHADSNITYSIPVRADNKAFQEVIAAANQAIDAFHSKDDSSLAAAQTLMTSGEQDFNAVRSSLSSTIVNIQGTNDNLKNTQLYWQSVTNDIGNTDLVAATTKISNYQAVLQATFQVYARLSSLRLSDYLK